MPYLSSTMKIIGLTGGIACGKSSVAKHLKETLGIPIVDADKISHDCLLPGSATYHKVVEAFGPGVLMDTSTPAKVLETAGYEAGGPPPVDRKKLGDVVFNDDRRRQVLNKIMSGAIGMGMVAAVAWHFAIGTRLLVLDVPLLYETKLDKVGHGRWAG